MFAEDPGNAPGQRQQISSHHDLRAIAAPLLRLAQTDVATRQEPRHSDLRNAARRCLDRKINREGTRQWRRLGSEYQSDLRCDAQTVNDYYARRLRHTACRNILRTPELRARYPHVSTQSAEAF